MAKQKPTKAQTAYGKSRAGGQNAMRITAKDVKRTAKAAAEVALLAVPIGKGAKIGQVAGKAAARALAKEASPKIASAANKARGAGKTVNPKPAMGKVERTAPKRDVVVKTEDKTLAIKGKFIDKAGRKSVKVNTKKPTVRTVEKEVTKKEASRRTASSNRLRYGASKAEASRGRTAIESSEILRKAGKAAGATAGSAPAVAKVKSQNKKKK